MASLRPAKAGVHRGLAALLQMNIAEECFNNNIRAEKILWLSCQADQYTDAMRKFFTEDISAEKLTAIFDGAVKFTEAQIEEAADSRRNIDDHIGEFVSRLYRAGKRGFLVQAATPVPQMFSPGGCVTTYGFGMYTTQWHYTDALDEVFIAQLIAWKESYIEACRQKEAGKKNSKAKAS